MLEGHRGEAELLAFPRAPEGFLVCPQQEWGLAGVAVPWLCRVPRHRGSASWVSLAQGQGGVSQLCPMAPHSPALLAPVRHCNDPLEKHLPCTAVNGLRCAGHLSEPMAGAAAAGAAAGGDAECSVPGQTRPGLERCWGTRSTSRSPVRRAALSIAHLGHRKRQIFGCLTNV